MAQDRSHRRPGIVVIGAPRSGTTLVRRILDHHPGIACPPETYLLSAAARFLFEESFAHGLQIGVTTGLGFAGFEEAEVLARLRTMVFGFLDDHAARQNKPRWAEKTAFNAFHLPAIRRVCDGHVQYLCVTRHGLDVVVSLADLVDKTGGYVDELHAYVRRHPEPLEAFAHAWVDTASTVADLAASDESTCEIRYEDLVGDADAVIRAALEGLGEPWVDGLVAEALAASNTVGFGDWKTYARGEIDASSVGRWKSLPRPTIRRLATICNPTLERLGYQPVEVMAENELSPQEARRRYEMGLLVNRMKQKG